MCIDEDLIIQTSDTLQHLTLGKATAVPIAFIAILQ